MQLHQQLAPTVAFNAAPDDAPVISVVDAVLRIIENEGVDRIFGVPGAALTPIYEAIARGRKLRHVLAKHEEGAAFMACGYAQVRLGLAVCCATTGPGATNALTGIASAYADSLPVLLLTGQTATRFHGKGAFQESSPFGVDLVQLFRPITKLSVMAPSAERVVDTVSHAIRLALSGRRGPVHVSLPSDFLRVTIDQPAATRIRVNSGGDCDPAVVATVATLLSSAAHPALLVGHGVSMSGAGAALARVATRAQVPVATTPKAKGVLAEDHPLSLGVLGFAGHPRAEHYLLAESVDVLVVVGSGLGEWSTNAWSSRLMPTRALVQVDIDPAAIGRNYPVDIAINADARRFFEMLADALPAQARRSDPLAATRSRVPRLIGAGMNESDSRPISPLAMIEEVRAATTDDTLFFVDIGNAMTWAGHYLECRAPNTYFVSLGLGSMGSALAGAIGGKLAAPPGRPVVCLVGDGAFAMNGMEVHTAVEHQIPVIWVVLNNAGHGMIAHGERLLLGHELGACEFKTPIDICGIAAALGARRFRASTRTELAAALREALAASAPCVIEVYVDGDVVPCSLAGRAAAVRGGLSPAAT